MQKSVHSLVQGSIYCSLAMPLLYHTSNGYRATAAATDRSHTAT